MIYKDLEKELYKYDYADSSKPKNTKTMNYDLLDQKAIRIINRLADHLQKNNKTIKDIFSTY